jgi:hypothetical protein
VLAKSEASPATVAVTGTVVGDEPPTRRRLSLESTNTPWKVGGSGQRAGRPYESVT